MAIRFLAIFALIVLLFGSLLAYSQEAQKSGPQPGEFLPGPFHPLNLNGSHAANLHCLVCEYGLAPVVLVFTRDLSKAAALLQKLDETVAPQQRVGLKSFAVVLSEDFGKEQNQKEVVQAREMNASELKNVVLAVVGPTGPEKYNITKDADVTVILYKKLKVVSNFALAKDKLGEKEIAAILAATQKMVTGP